MSDSRPDSALNALSVVVTIVDGAAALARCLTALSEQHDPPRMDVIVPYDESVRDAADLSVRFPLFRFLALGELSSDPPASGPLDQHELYDRRRSAGLAAATGGIVAILEDRGVPRPDWARRMVNAHHDLPHAVIGGAVQNGCSATLNWAVYFCDFGRYQLPLTAGPREWVTDVNVGYKRRALDQTRHLWNRRYHETTVHWALRRAGETLYLTPDLIVDQIRGPLRLRALLVERFSWGRLFAYTRAREVSGLRRLVFASLTPALPAILFLRLMRLQLGKRVTLGKFIRATPAVLVLLSAWSIGEAVGYVTGKPQG